MRPKKIKTVGEKRNKTTEEILALVKAFPFLFSDPDDLSVFNDPMLSSGTEEETEAVLTRVFGSKRKID